MMDNSQQLLRDYQTGKPAAAREIYERYAVRLIAVARAMLASSLRRRIDPEDVVQSAYRSFFVKAREGKYQLHASGDLWHLLIAITRHKVLNEVERQTAAKRAPQREQPPADVAGEELDPPIVALIAEELQQAIQKLPAEERRLLELRLQDASIDEMAAAIGKSPRTIRRMLLDLRRTLQRRLATSATDTSAPVYTSRVAPLNYREFRLEQMVGAGGFGKVYRAFWDARQTKVAIKSLRKQLLLDARAVKAFLREAEMIAQLRHPGIIGLHGMGRTPGGGFFLVLDWHVAGNLEQQSSFSFEQEIRIVMEAAEAIAYAHGQEIVHCDLKPSNLLMTEEGRTVVTDFGFAVALSRAAALSSETNLGGTPGYLAPEIMTDEVTAACDVFSLGRVLRFVLNRRRTDVSAPQRQKLLDLISRCERPPTERPSAQQLAEALRSLVQRLPPG